MTISTACTVLAKDLTLILKMRYEIQNPAVSLHSCRSSRKNVHRVVLGMRQGDDPALQTFLSHISFGCDVQYKVIPFSWFSSGRICLCLEDRQGRQTSTGMKCCCSCLYFLLIKLHSSLRRFVSHYLENHLECGTNRCVKGEQNLLPPACSSTLTGLCPEESVPQQQHWPFLVAARALPLSAV